MSATQKMPVVVAAVLVLVLVFGPLIMADHVSLPELRAIGYSVFLGVLMALLGYAKAPATESFDPEKFLITPLTGVLAGLVMGLYGYSYSAAITWLANAGVLSLVELLGKALVRRFWHGT